MAGGAASLLKRFEGEGGAGAVWSPNGRHMAVSHRTTTTDLVLIRGFGPAAAPAK